MPSRDAVQSIGAPRKSMRITNAKRSKKKKRSSLTPTGGGSDVVANPFVAASYRPSERTLPFEALARPVSRTSTSSSASINFEDLSEDVFRIDWGDAELQTRQEQFRWAWKSQIQGFAWAVALGTAFCLGNCFAAAAPRWAAIANSFGLIAMYGFFREMYCDNEQHVQAGSKYLHAHKNALAEQKFSHACNHLQAVFGLIEARRRLGNFTASAQALCVLQKLDEKGAMRGSAVDVAPFSAQQTQLLAAGDTRPVAVPEVKTKLYLI